MVEGTHLNRLEELTLSNKQEVTTLSRGLVEANERIADTQAQLMNMDSSLRSIEKLLCDNLKLKLKVNDYGLRVKVTDLPMFDGEGVEDWVFRARQYLETFEIPMEQRIRVLSFYLVGADYAWYRWRINNNMAYTCEAFLEAMKIQTNPTSTNPAYPVILHSTNTPTKEPQPPFKKLTSAEIRARREKGLCYYCDDKCQLLIGEEELRELLQGTTGGNGEVHELDTEEEEEEGEQQNPRIKLNAFEGEFHPETLRVKGTHANKQLLILIDGGSTYNFIKGSIAKNLNLSLTPTPALKVMVGNGESINCAAKCRDLSLLVQGYRFSADMYVLDLKRADVVLGVHWMMRLGTIRINYMELFMKFKKMGTWITFRAIPSVEEPVPEVEEVAIQTIIEEFTDVFEEPKQLPPHRAINHPIHFTLGASPISIRPYKYLHFQKEEMERLVSKMLQARLIGDSQSAFSSPPFIVETDASSTGVRAVLSQGGHPIAYFSKKLGARLSQASAYVRKLYAVTQAVAKWRHYLLGQKFLIRTDHQGLRELMTQVILTPEQQHYLSKLLGYEFEIEYLPGKFNKVADALSKLGDDEHHTQLQAFTAVQSNLLPTLLQANNESEEMLQLQEKLQRGTLPSEYVFKDGLMTYRGKVWVLNVANIRETLLHQFHSALTVGHGGILKTYKGLGELFFWPGMRQDVVRFVNRCVECQCTKYITAKPQGLLQPLPVLAKPWEDISLDFITKIPNSNGFTAVLEVVDQFSKTARVAPLKTGFTAKLVAQKFIKSVHFGTKLLYSTAYHPQTDGQTEVVNRTLEQYLCVFTHAHPTKWSAYLNWADFCYNNSFYYTIEMSPHDALYGFAVRTIPGYTSRSSLVLQRVGTVVYKLELPVGSAIHPVFHVSLLKEFKGESVMAGGINELPLSLPFELVPVAIIDSRTLQLDDGSQDV
ncbi:uncharacterized protein [Arachis hypogaea]|uniref:uncharacterized protein n=1 Tax=Arachis hypogaea TaxID=3818 RepID=UPI003B20F0A4